MFFYKINLVVEVLLVVLSMLIFYGMGENFETVKTGKGQEESTQEEIDALKEKNSQAKERTVNLSTIMYLAIYMLVFFSALCI